MSDITTPSYYAVIPAIVRYAKSITPNAKLLYGEITALCNDKGYCWASNNYFAELYDVTPQAISKWVNSLSDNGFIKLEYEYNGKEIKERRIYITDVSTQGLQVSTKDEKGINKKLKGYQQKVKDNTISGNNTIPNTIYNEIETAYINAFKTVIPNGEPILDYGAIRKRQKAVLSKLPKEKILLAIERAKKDKWIIENGFSLLLILGDFQLNKLINGQSQSSYSKPLPVQTRTTFLDMED